MGLGPDIWGPHGWKFIHFVSLGYPKKPTNDDKNSYKNFFSTIPNILPCSICSNHFKENLLKYPLTDEVMSDKMKLFYWSVDMHNEVNKSQNKKIVTYEEALELVINNFKTNDVNDINDNKYETFIDINNSQKKNIKNKDYTLYIISFFLLIITIFLIYYKLKICK